MKYILSIAVICVGGVITGVVSRSRDQGVTPAADQKPAPVVRRYPVRVQEIKGEPVHYEIHAVGTIEAKDTYRVDSQVAGTIYDVGFDEGDDVSASQTLLRIAPDAYRLAAARDEAAAQRTSEAMVPACARVSSRAHLRGF